MAALELDDIQGILLRDYHELDGAVFVLLRFDDARAATHWLADLSATLTSARRPPGEQAVNLAFTSQGLAALGLRDATGFPTEFLQGMVTPHRSRILGDTDDDAPDTWAWGGPRTAVVHALLMLYARDDEAARAIHVRARQAYAASGVAEVGVLTTHLLKIPGGVKEHFGFRDGIGQPAIATGAVAADAVFDGTLVPSNPANTVAAGEFVIGYPNEYGQCAEGPFVGDDPTGCLPPIGGGKTGFDLGRNGTYLVVRQLAQHVVPFWQYVRSAAGGSDEAIRLAAKMMGRWPSGAPLVLSPERDRAELGAADDFGYAGTDSDGFACPFGAHARRANPRDALPDLDAVQSTRETKRHRIIRRGRAYGSPLHPSCDPARIMETPDDGAERGLHFLCLNADLERQFEFIQHTWLGNPTFDGLYSDPDPLVGGRLSGEAVFVEQARPVRRRWRGLPSFVRVRGGAYFFLPGLRALRYVVTRP